MAEKDRKRIAIALSAVYFAGPALSVGPARLELEIEGFVYIERLDPGLVASRLGAQVGDLAQALEGLIRNELEFELCSWGEGWGEVFESDQWRYGVQPEGGSNG